MPELRDIDANGLPATIVAAEEAGNRVPLLDTSRATRLPVRSLAKLVAEHQPSGQTEQDRSANPAAMYVYGVTNLAVSHAQPGCSV